MKTKSSSEIMHYGVLGMKWGRRKSEQEIARSNREKAVNQARRLTKMSSSGGKKTGKMTDKELDDELETLSIHYSLNGKNRFDKIKNSFVLTDA